MAAAVRGPLGLRLAAFAGLCLFVALHWARLLVGAPTGRVLLAALIGVAGTTAIAVIASAGISRPRGNLAAAAVLLGSLALGAAGAGVPVRMLAPTSWGELMDNLGGGIGILGTSTYPYAGDDPWARLTLLFGLSALIVAAGAVAFWPANPLAGARRVASLAILVGAYGVAATLTDPPLALLQGAVLFGLVCLWLWTPPGPRRAVLAGLGLIAMAALLAVPVSARVASRDPVLDYTRWDWSPEEEKSTEFFTWNHSYGPIDWPRTGRQLLFVRARSGHYWKTLSLDRFDGFRWLSSSDTGLPPLERPWPLTRSDRRWIRTIDFRVAALSSQYVVTPGSVLAVSGLGARVSTGSGVLLGDSDGISSGDEYTVRAYAPTPSPARMRAAGFATDPRLRRYTTIGLPRRVGEDTSVGGGLTHETDEAVVQALVGSLTVPLRQRGGRAPRGDAARLLASSPYGRVYRLSRRLTGPARNAYEAAVAIRDHLRSAYSYSENPPERTFPLAAFLFRDRIGYCQQFSGAMALMLRMAGIPARVATGFSPGTPTRSGFTVTDLDAHSWVEVYFSGIGWVGFDPTPAAAPAASLSSGPAAPLPRPRGRSLPPIGRGGPGVPVETTAPGPADADGWRTLLGVGVLGVALVALGAVAIRRRRLGGERLAAAQIAELRSGLERMGTDLDAGITLHRLERSSRGLGRHALADYARTLRLYRYAHGTDLPGGADRRRLRTELGRRGGIGATARAYLAISPLGPRPVD